jgi:hypothetical protein
MGRRRHVDTHRVITRLMGMAARLSLTGRKLYRYTIFGRTWNRMEKTTAYGLDGFLRTPRDGGKADPGLLGVPIAA